MSDTTPLNVLVSLYRGYGLGDAVAMSAVLRHLRKYRPNWRIDFQAEPGRSCVGDGIAHNTLVYGYPYPSHRYDVDIPIILFDTYYKWTDRPNTRVTSCLHKVFGLDWDAECGRYQIKISKDAQYRVTRIMPRKAVAIHYKGDTAPDKKDLSHEQIAEVCGMVHKLGRVPLLLDWRNQSPLRDISGIGIQTTGGYPFSLEWGGDAEMNCAVISQCEAFIGIDSGPAKCASATNTPSLVVWTRHHPGVYHDPAPNTTHLVPFGYRQLHPVCGDPDITAWFENRYNLLSYESDPVREIGKWLLKILV